MSKQADKPWECQKGESAQAFEAFMVYLKLGDDRSVRAVGQECAKSRSLISRWCTTYRWVERATAYDADVQKKAHAAAVKEQKKMAERHIDIAMQLQKKALEALKELSVEDMTPKDIKEYIKMATDLERLNRTLEEESSKAKEDGPAQLAETIISAYQRRKEQGNA